MGVFRGVCGVSKGLPLHRLQQPPHPPGEELGWGFRGELWGLRVFEWGLGGFMEFEKDLWEFGGC